LNSNSSNQLINPFFIYHTWEVFELCHHIPFLFRDFNFKWNYRFYWDCPIWGPIGGECFREERGRMEELSLWFFRTRREYDSTRTPIPWDSGHKQFTKVSFYRCTCKFFICYVCLVHKTRNVTIVLWFNFKYFSNTILEFLFFLMLIEFVWGPSAHEHRKSSPMVSNVYGEV
jgi:hypothetical protein